MVELRRPVATETMGLLDFLAVLLTGSGIDRDPGSSVQSASSLYECRRCGTTVDRSTESCPTCGEGEIAEYTLE